MTRRLRPQAVFAQHMARREEQINLAEAALLYARAEYPRLLVPAYLQRLDELAGAVSRRLPPAASGRRTLEVLNTYLFETEGFAGNGDAYYDPRNSYLNEVLDRRLGIPITLSVVYLEVGRRLGLTLDGIGFPGHFLVRYTEGEEKLFLDVFHGGRVVEENTLRAQPEFRESYLAAVSKRQILTRMLTNLKHIYVSGGDFARAARTTDFLLSVNPGKLDEIRDRGLIRYQLGQYLPALIDLETYLRYAPAGQERTALRQSAQKIWKQLTRLN